MSVSYTHLDVYKRQPLYPAKMSLPLALSFPLPQKQNSPKIQTIEKALKRLRIMCFPPLKGLHFPVRSPKAAPQMTTLIQEISGSFFSYSFSLKREGAKAPSSI